MYCWPSSVKFYERKNNNMFEDIIGSYQTPESETAHARTLGPDEVCPMCGSQDIGILYGGGGLYFSMMICAVCNGKWVVHYDTDLNVVDYEITV